MHNPPAFETTGDGTEPSRSPWSGSIGSERHGGASSLRRFLEAASRLLGADSVATDPVTLSRYARTTLPISPVVAAVLRPASVSAVSAVRRLASQFGVQMHSVSTGRNWGYGSAAPPPGVQVVLELRRLDRIRSFDAALGVVWVEPGVTQRQLFEFLRSTPGGGAWWTDATGSAADSSLIGNIAQRGFGHTAYGDRIEHVTGLEVVLRDGTVANTTFGGNPDAHAAGVFKWGLGPQLDGLFIQSRLGTITAMAIELMPRPQAAVAFLARIDDESRLPGLVDGLAQLRRTATVRSCVHLANAWKAVAAIRRFPFGEHDRSRSLPQEWLLAERRRLGLGAWSATGALYGSRREVAAHSAEVRRVLRAHGARVQTFALSTIGRLQRWLPRLPRPLQTRFGSRVALLGTLGRLLEGIPGDDSLPSAYWRWEGEIPTSPDPDADGCGLLWWPPVLRAVGHSVREIVDDVERTVRGQGFEPMISGTMVSGRAFCLVVSVMFDLRDPEESARAGAAVAALQRLQDGRRLVPYRCGLAFSEPRSDAGARRLAKLLERTL